MNNQDHFRVTNAVTSEGRLRDCGLLGGWGVSDPALDDIIREGLSEAKSSGALVRSSQLSKYLGELGYQVEGTPST